MKKLLLGCVLLLAGCVGAPMNPSNTVEVAGQVELATPLMQPAHITLRLYTTKDGAPKLIARQRYQVSMLPVQFSFSLDAQPQAAAELLLGGTLSWADEGAAQARSWQPVVPGREVKMVLQPLPCYPRCAR